MWMKHLAFKWPSQSFRQLVLIPYRIGLQKGASNDIHWLGNVSCSVYLCKTQRTQVRAINNKFFRQPSNPREFQIPHQYQVWQFCRCVSEHLLHQSPSNTLLLHLCLWWADEIILSHFAWQIGILKQSSAVHIALSLILMTTPEVFSHICNESLWKISKWKSM